MNETIKCQTQHRTIRKFKPDAMTKAQLDAILSAASATPTYTFLQAASIIHVKDAKKKKQISDICKQPYVAEAPDLFIIIADFNRDARIAAAKGADLSALESADRFLSTFYDATLMAMNMVTAAESLGLGTVFLGSINNDMEGIIRLLELPKYTFPCLGIGMGVPDQHPTLKPRLPHRFIYMEDTYRPMDDPLAELADYDAIVHEYYDLRNANQRVDTFTNQMAKAMEHIVPGRMKILETLQKQGFLKR